MKHILILLISILLLSSFITSCVKNGSSPVKVETYTYPDGGKYVGKFKDGKKNGQGTMTETDGRKYEGKWKDGELWNGTLYDKYGNIYGKKVNGKRIKQ